jgi:hypothetical protein
MRRLPVPSRSRLITGFVTRLTRWVSLVEQELLTLLEHLRSLPVVSGVRVTPSLVLYVCFVDSCLSFCTFFFWPLCCQFFDIRILITPLVSSNSSWNWSSLFISMFNTEKMILLNICLVIFTMTLFLSHDFVHHTKYVINPLLINII